MELAVKAREATTMSGGKGLLMEHRMKLLEEAVRDIRDLLQKLSDYATTKETIARAFHRLEAMETAIKGDGTKPGLFAHVLGIETKLENNTFLTRMIVGLMVAQFIGAVGLGMYMLFKSSGAIP
jgi:hypothetical protein